jgi:L-fuconolactonase
MIVDAHHHLWDPARREYPWMTGDAARLRRRFDGDDLRRATAGLGVERTVLVQAVGTVEETEELLATAAADPDGLLAGVVGWVDLTGPDVAGALARLVAGHGGRRLVGIRHQVHDEADPDWLARPAVLAGLRAVADAGLVYDLLVRSRELPAALRAAQAVPQLAFVVDHAAKPAIRAGEWEPWSSRIAALAALPNVTCKLSGLVTEARVPGWSPDDLAPYVARLVELFGPGRLLFGSDWPVCTLAASYREVLDAATACLDRAGVGEPGRAEVLAGTAERVYRLERRGDPRPAHTGPSG